jgi:hypothetical protein
MLGWKRSLSFTSEVDDKSLSWIRIGKCGSRAPGLVDGKYSCLLPVGRGSPFPIISVGSGTKAPSKYLQLVRLNTYKISRYV